METTSVESTMAPIKRPEEEEGRMERTAVLEREEQGLISSHKK